MLENYIKLAEFHGMTATFEEASDESDRTHNG